MGLDLVTLAAAKAYTDKMIPQGGGGLAGFELIDTIDFSTEEMAKANAGKEYDLDNVTEVVAVWKNMKNGTATASNVLCGANGAYSNYHICKTAANTGVLNGYTYLKVFEGVGTIAFMSAGATANNNYTFNNQQRPYNLFPIKEPITKLYIYNPVTQYFATGGTIDVYVR